MQLLAAAKEYLPEPQLLQLRAAAKECLPAPQRMHEAAVLWPDPLSMPVDPLYLPATHSMQLLAAANPEYFPVPQLMQLLAAAKEYLPAPQLMHEVTDV